MMRLQAGLREPAYEASVRKMLAGGLIGEEEIPKDENKNKTLNLKDTKEIKDINDISSTDEIDALNGKMAKKVEKDTENPTNSACLKKEKKTMKNSTQLNSGLENKVVCSVSNEDQEGPTETEDVDDDEDDVDDDENEDGTSGSDDSTESNNEKEDENDENEDDGWVERKESDGKYRKQLPARDDPAARLAEKDSRKEARKLAKDQAAKKRQEKVPKHVKKRAIKAGKKK